MYLKLIFFLNIFKLIGFQFFYFQNNNDFPINLIVLYRILNQVKKNKLILWQIKNHFTTIKIYLWNKYINISAEYLNLKRQKYFIYNFDDILTCGEIQRKLIFIYLHPLNLAFVIKPERIWSLLNGRDHVDGCQSFLFIFLQFAHCLILIVSLLKFNLTTYDL